MGSFKGKVRGSNVHEEFFLTPRLGEIVYDIFLIVVMNILHLIYWLIQSDWHTMYVGKGAGPVLVDLAEIFAFVMVVFLPLL